MRLRTTAPPSAFLMLKPKRLSGNWFARKKTVKWEFERRLPVRYTASNSPRRTIRASRGNSRPPGLLGREPMASLLAARRQHLAASDGLHAYAKSVRLGTPPFSRLICSLWQSNPPRFPTMLSTTLPLPFSYYSLFHTTWRANLVFHRAHRAVRASGRPSTSRISGLFRISKCSRPLRSRSRNLRRKLIPRRSLSGVAICLDPRVVIVLPRHADEHEPYSRYGENLSRTSCVRTCRCGFWRHHFGLA